MREREFKLLHTLRGVSESSWNLETEYSNKALSRYRLQRRLGKLSRRGWITQDVDNQWILTAAGQEQVGVLENWEVVAEIVAALPSEKFRRTASDPRPRPSVWIRGELNRGIPTWPDGYLIHRNGVLSGFGAVIDSSYSEPGEGHLFTLFADGDLPMPGDVLTRGSSNPSSD